MTCTFKIFICCTCVFTDMMIIVDVDSLEFTLFVNIFFFICIPTLPRGYCFWVSDMWPMTYQDVTNITFPFPLDTFPWLCSIDSFICDCEATNNISNQVSLTGSWSPLLSGYLLLFLCWFKHGIYHRQSRTP